VAVVVGVPLRVVRAVHALKGQHTRKGSRTRSPRKFSNVPESQPLIFKVEKYCSPVDVQIIPWSVRDCGTYGNGEPKLGDEKTDIPPHEILINIRPERIRAGQ
jgi:hypothetical protein